MYSLSPSRVHGSGAHERSVRGADAPPVMRITGTRCPMVGWVGGRAGGWAGGDGSSAVAWATGPAPRAWGFARVRRMSDSPLRVVVAKPGLDGHDRGAKVVARAPVSYTHLDVYKRQAPEWEILDAASADLRRVLTGEEADHG